MPTPQLTGSGLDEAEIAIVLSYIENGRNGQGFINAISKNNNIEKNDILVKLMGRYNDLMDDKANLLVDEDSFWAFFTRITTEFVNNL